MKLQNQLNIAFAMVLLVILTVTGFFVYSLILDLLIQDEQRQLAQKGELLVNVLNEEYQTVFEFSEFLQEQDLQLFMYDRKSDQIRFSTMSAQDAQGFFLSNDFSDNGKELWEYRNDKYVISKILIYPPSAGLELILLTPLNDLQAVQQSFIRSLLIVFMIGAIVTVMISSFLTNKLVTPLTRLKWQLKKIEKRQFDDIKRIKATGEIKEVEQSVFDMAQELQRYMKSQQTFFQNASHELKTPLMTIQGYAEGIRDQVFDAEESEQGLEIMVTEVNRLKKIINEMILLAKLDSEQNTDQAEQIQVDELIDQVMGRTLPLVNEKEIELYYDVDDDAVIFVDEEKLLRALLNVTINGIRYAKNIVKITVLKQANTVNVIIEDDGEGISEDILPHVFHRFVKGKDGETGLGLAISYAIVEQNGGKIIVQKSELGGAKFVLTFIEKK